MPKFCPTCGKPLKFENAEICPNCGVRIPGSSLDSVHPVQNKTSYYVGIVSLIAWLLPIIGIPVSIIGLYLGDKEKKKGENSVRNGILFSAIGLILSIINGIAGGILAIMRM
jgi:hypothetical protein